MAVFSGSLTPLPVVPVAPLAALPLVPLVLLALVLLVPLVPLVLLLLLAAVVEVPLVPDELVGFDDPQAPATSATAPRTLASITRFLRLLASNTLLLPFLRLGFHPHRPPPAELPAALSPGSSALVSLSKRKRSIQHPP